MRIVVIHGLRSFYPFTVTFSSGLPHTGNLEAEIENVGPTCHYWGKV